MSELSPTAPILAQAHSGRDEKVAFAIMTVLLVVAPFAIYPFFLMQALCIALFACAFNLLVGYVGLLSFGHAMFLGLASYVSAHAAKVWGLDPGLAIVAGAASAAALGIVTGALAIRRQGIYFAMITLALSQMIYFFCLEAPFTHGEDGIQSVPQGKLLGIVDLSNQTLLYYFVLAIFLFGFLVIYRTINSPFGDILKAIRENEPRAVSLGYRVDQYKLAAFVLSATLAGLAGGGQGDLRAERFADRRAILDVGRGRADDAARRHGHDLRTGGRRFHRRRDAAISRPISRRMGDGDPGLHFRRLRAAVPPRHRRGDRGILQTIVVGASAA